MKYIAALVVLGLIFFAGLVNAQNTDILKSENDKISYSVGVDIGLGVKNLPIGVNLDLLFKGMRDVLLGTKPLMTEQEIREAMMSLQKEVKAKLEDRRGVLGEKNKKEGESFLAENKNKDGVVTLPSGLEYKVLKAGIGKTPTEEDTVIVQYRGTLIDGTEFDSTYHRGQPAAFPVKGIIPGWTEALKLMQEGAKWQIFIPPSLAYGERGAGGQIGPDATLIFEVELLSIQEKKQD